MEVSSLKMTVSQNSAGFLAYYWAHSSLASLCAFVSLGFLLILHAFRTSPMKDILDSPGRRDA